MFKNKERWWSGIARLNTKQMVFCMEYLKDLNGARAYKVAYPYCKKDSTARANSSRLLKDANIKAHIDEKLKEIESHKIMNVKEVLERLTIVGRGELIEEVLSNTGEILNKTVGAKDQIKGLELLGKYHSLFTDRLDAKLDNTVVIVSGENDLEN